MQRIRGFTLIELMVVLAVIAIIMAIAVPAFTEQMRKSRRSQATGGLSDLQLRQERWRASNSTYAPGTASPPADVGIPTADHYTFAVTAGSNTGTDVVMTATPIGAQVGDRCGTYTLRIDNNNDNTPPAGRLDKTTSTGLTTCW